MEFHHPWSAIIVLPLCGILLCSLEIPGHVSFQASSLNGEESLEKNKKNILVSRSQSSPTSYRFVLVTDPTCPPSFVRIRPSSFETSCSQINCGECISSIHRGGSDLITADKDVSAFDGKTAVLKCSYNGSREINSVKWTNKSSNVIAERSRGDDFLPDSRIKFVESSEKTNGSIIIDPVRMRDTGTYTCGYDVQGQVPMEKAITLNVKQDSTSLWKIVIPIVVIGLLLSIAGIVFFLYKKGHLRKKPSIDRDDKDLEQNEMHPMKAFR